MDKLTPAHFILPLTVVALVCFALRSYYRQLASQERPEPELKQEPLQRLDYLLAATLAMGFFCLTLWRLDFPARAVFDECYHSRTGMQYLIGQNPMEWTHPPLAKLIIAGGLKLFGGEFNPTEGIYKPDMGFSHAAAFGWRFGSAVFGALSLLLMFFLARAVTGNRMAAVLATGMLALDGVFFVQSRIAMTNIYTVCFILMAALAAWIYNAQKKPLWLPVLGVALGLAIATRWTTLYAFGLIALWLLFQDVPRVAKHPKVLGLAGFGVVLLGVLFFQVRKFYLADPAYPDNSQKILTALVPMLIGATLSYALTYGVLRWTERRSEGAALLALPGWYLLSFIAIPVALYLLMYLPYMRQGHDLHKVFDEQRNMWNYHAGMRETHPYSSPWWSWPLVLRPTWYEYSSVGPGDNRITGILCIGNVFVWWASVPALGFALWRTYKDRHRGLGFAALMGLGLWLAWAIQPRPLVFLHYFFEALPFACIALGYFGARLWSSRDEDSRYMAAGYGALILFWFGFFYPLLSALPIPQLYLQMHIWLGKLWL
jgi:dolichyl-phosphate-mannose-protein mannosyltransferase